MAFELTDKLKKVAEKIFNIRIVSKDAEQSGYTRPVMRDMELYDKESIRSDRLNVIEDVEKMARTDPRVKRILMKLASDAAVGGFNVQVKTAPGDALKEQAQNIIDEVVSVCKIKSKLKGWVFAQIRDGDLFLEVTVGDTKITRLKRIATKITHSNLNNEGNFPEGEPAYYQEHPWSREKVRTFEPWQIVHIPWEYIDGEIYGQSMMGAARLTFKRLDKSEENVVIRRSVRAGVRYFHSVGTKDNPGSWEGVEEYKERNRDTLDNPLDPVQDFYGDGLVSIERLEGDTSIGDMDDIKHFEGMLSMTAGVPMALLSGGREENINRDILEEQEEDYFRVIADINQGMEAGLRKVFSFALLLAGINDEAIKYTFNWGAKDRDDIDAKIDRALKLQKLGYSFETIVETCDLDEMDFEAELERIKAQLEDGTIPYGIGIEPQIFTITGAAPQTYSPTANEQLLEHVRELRRDVENYSNGKIINIGSKRSESSL